MNAMPGSSNPDSVWPDLTLSSWEDTRDTFHMWTQVVGKIRLALEPMVNHWWQVTLYVSARGLTTSLMHAGTTGLEIEFDLIDHVLELRSADGRKRHVALEPRSVASWCFSIGMVTFALESIFGEMWHEAAPGGGSIFSLTIPDAEGATR